MYACPKCSRKTFRFTAKLWSWVALPAKCRECDGLCFAPTSPNGVLLVINLVLLTAAGFASVYWHSPIPFTVGAVVAVWLWLYRLHIQPLLPLSAEQAAMARKREGFWLFVFIVLSAIQ